MSDSLNSSILLLEDEDPQTAVNSIPHLSVSSFHTRLSQDITLATLKSSKLLLNSVQVLNDLSIGLSLQPMDKQKEEESLAFLELLHEKTLAWIEHLQQIQHEMMFFNDAYQYLSKQLPHDDLHLSNKITFKLLASQGMTETQVQLMNTQPLSQTVNPTENPQESAKAVEDGISQKIKMFPKVPKELIQADTEKQELLRLSSAYELLTTEFEYVRDISIILHYLKNQFKESGLVTESDLVHVFSNTEEVMTANKLLLSKLLARKEHDPKLIDLSEAILESADKFKVYSIYCGNYPKAMKTVTALKTNTEFSAFLTKLMSGTEAKGLSLESFLIKPVQRICKYPLLLREIIKYTDDASPEKKELEAAFEKFEQVVALVNDVTRQIENREKNITLLESIETSIDLPLLNSRLLKEGPVSWLVGTRGKERYLFLYEEALLICKNVKGKYLLENGYMISELEMKNDGNSEVASAAKLKNMLQFFILTDNLNELFFSLSSETELSKWIIQFETAFKAQFSEQRLPEENERLAKLENELQRLRSTTKDRQTYNRSSYFGPRKKVSEFGNYNLIEIEELKASQKQLQISEPELIIVENQRWKKALAVTGQIYYFNLITKETIWGLPETFEIVEEETHSRMQSNEDSLDPLVELEIVEGHPDWRRVSKGDISYFYNINTRETTWDLEEMQESG